MLFLFALQAFYLLLQFGGTLVVLTFLALALLFEQLFECGFLLVEALALRQVVYQCVGRTTSILQHL